MIITRNCRTNQYKATPPPYIGVHVVLRETKWLCGAILHELGSQQYHLRLKVKWGMVGLPKSAVGPHTPHKFGFHHFWPLNILNWSFLWFWKSIPHDNKNMPHGQKTYHMAKWYDFNYHMTHTKSYSMWYSPNHGIKAHICTSTFKWLNHHHMNYIALF